MIQLENVKPIPLLPNGIDSNSNIWACNCRFEKGKKYLIKAPSGKGKSTFIHLLYGLRQDYEGALIFAKEDVRNHPHDTWSAIRREQLSIVFQDLRLFPQLTALENIQLKAHLSDYKDDEAIQKMAKILGIDNLLDQKAATLSYGQQQRVAIIRALCQPFDFLLLDEPFSHLDKANIKAASNLINTALKAQKAGMILVSLGEEYLFEYDSELIL